MEERKADAVTNIAFWDCDAVSDEIERLGSVVTGLKSFMRMGRIRGAREKSVTKAEKRLIERYTTASTNTIMQHGKFPRMQYPAWAPNCDKEKWEDGMEAVIDEWLSIKHKMQQSHKQKLKKLSASVNARNRATHDAEDAQFAADERADAIRGELLRRGV